MRAAASQHLCTTPAIRRQDRIAIRRRLLLRSDNYIDDAVSEVHHPSTI